MPLRLEPGSPGSSPCPPSQATQLCGPQPPPALPPKSSAYCQGFPYPCLLSPQSVLPHAATRNFCLPAGPCHSPWKPLSGHHQRGRSPYLGCSLDGPCPVWHHGLSPGTRLHWVSAGLPPQQAWEPPSGRQVDGSEGTHLSSPCPMRAFPPKHPTVLAPTGLSFPTLMNGALRHPATPQPGGHSLASVTCIRCLPALPALPAPLVSRCTSFHRPHPVQAPG